MTGAERRPPRPELRSAAVTDPREEILIRYGLGVGPLRGDGKGITFQVAMFHLDGTPDGEVVITSETIADDPRVLIEPPPTPPIRVNDQEPVEHLSTLSYGKARWVRRDGSSITALGVGNSIIVNLKTDDVFTTEALAMTISSGTGVYEGARGMWTANRTVLNPPGGTLIGSEGDFHQKQLHVIRVTRGAFVASAGPGQSAS